jgi:acyl dehydratase
MPKIVPLDELYSYAGKDFGRSNWLEIDQERINKFADATNDHQFIHVDEKAAAATPFGSTIAHGFLTLSLVSYFIADLMVLPKDLKMVINYGLEKVRFIQPVKVGQSLRAHMVNIEITEKRPGEIIIRSTVTLEIKGQEKPACVAEFIGLVMV